MSFDEQKYKKYNEYIVKEVEDGVRQVIFNNPKSLNAFSESTWKQYQEILEELDRDPETLVIIISSGIAKAFTLGLNLKSALASMGQFVDASEEERRQGLHKHISEFQRAIATPARINTPTICVINGLALGLALDIALACSIRIASKDAKLLIREIKIGIPADIGSLQRIPRLVNNQSRLNELALTGEFFGAKEAQELGFVSKILPDFESAVKHAITLAADIAGHQQWAIRGTKQCIQQINDGATHEEGLNFIADYNSKNINGNFLKAIKSVL